MNRFLILPVITYLAVFALLFLMVRALMNPDDFFAIQLRSSQALSLLILLHLAIVSFIFRKRGLARWREFFSEPVSPYSLAIFRIGFFGLINGMYWYQLQNAAVMQSGVAPLVPLPFTEWYAGLIPMDYGFYKAAYYAGTAVAIMSALGIGYRYIAWLNILFAFYLIGAPMFLGKLFYMQLWFWGACLMAFAPAADVLSADALISRLKGQQPATAPRAAYGIALKWFWLHLGIIYFFSAIWKLLDTGLAWALSDSMINQMHVEWLTNYHEIPALRLDLVPWLAHAGGMYILVVELVFIFLLFSKRLRWMAVLMGLSIHWGAAYFLHLSMGDLQFMYLSIVCVLIIPTRKAEPLETTISAPSTTGRLTMRIGAGLLVVNSLCGLFNISSWPFSAYPSHSAYIGPTFSRVEFEVREAGLKGSDIDSIGRHNGFRKDNYYNLSDAAIGAYQRGDTEEMRQNLEMLWANWQTNNPELMQYDHPQAYLLETPVHPERWHDVLRWERMEALGE